MLDIVIPLYNSSANLPALIKRLNEWAKSIDFDFHVIFVEDGITDNSKEVVIKADKMFTFQYVQLGVNYGQHSATAVGLGHSEADLVVTIDDDLQHDPFEINKLLESQKESDSDLVFGEFDKKRHSFIRNLGSKLLKFIFSLDGTDYSEVTSFRLMKKSVARQFNGLKKPIVFIEDFLIKAATKRSSCIVNHSERESGKSGYSFFKLLQFAFKVVLFHSSLLLKLIVRLGLLIAFICFGLGCFFIYKKVVFDSQMGFSALIVSIFFSTAILLITLGIIGEYIRRIWVGQQGLQELIIIEEE